MTAVPDRPSVEQLMKRCQIGVGGRNAIDDAHSIMAECYGTLGALLAEIEKLRAELFEWQALRDPHVLHSNLLRGLPALLSREQLRHVLGDPPSRDDPEAKT